VRTHGDFHLGRLWRIEQGWYVGDFSPAGWPPSPLSGPPAPLVEEEGVPYRPPLADVADVMWSFAHVATSAANERDPAGREGLDELAQAWEQRNRRSFLDGYLGVPGITELVPASREAVRVVVAAFEVEVASR
jgi:predicted trehalose synthase